MRIRLTIWIALILFCTLSFAVATTAQMGADGRITLVGISVVPPGGEGWRRVVLKPFSNFPIGYAKFAGADRADKHTVAVQVEVSFDKTLRYHNEQAIFDGLKKNLTRVTSTNPQLTIKNSKAVMMSFNGHRCMNFAMEVTGEKKFISRIWGFKCPHPYIPPQILEISYSQRSLSGAWNSNLDGEARVFIDGVKFTATIMGPYVGGLMRDYIRILRQRREDRRADSLQTTIDHYNELLKKKDMIGAFGVDFTVHLTGYADFLDRIGQTNRATEVRLIARTFKTNQDENQRVNTEMKRRPR